MRRVVTLLSLTLFLVIQGRTEFLQMALSIFGMD